MLYEQSKRYLLDKLVAAGLKTRPYTTEKGLAKSMESHVGAVLFESEDYTRNGSKTYYVDETGSRKKRRKVFDRKLSFTVTIGDYNDEAVETIAAAFIAGLDKGIYVDGNYVPIELDGAAWVADEDSILRARVAMQIKIDFHGGVYRDTGFAKVSELEVVSVEKDNGKEPADGDE
ncbi:MAG: SON protein [Oscillospiraceae bacterium]|nr:SON protein [Oscillospiraceae bacterium]